MENNKETTKQYKIFGLLLEVRDTVFLSVQYASSLEEAFAQAKLEFYKINPLVKNSAIGNLLGSKIGLFTIKSIKELTEENETFYSRRVAYEKIEEENKKNPSIKKFIKQPTEMDNVKKVDPIQLELEKKNQLMRLIIVQKDKDLFEKNKDLFTDSESQYIIERLSKDVK